MDLANHVENRTSFSGFNSKQEGLSLVNPGISQVLGFPDDSVIKYTPAMLGTWIRSLVQEDPLEKGMATQFNILAWKIPWTEEPGKLQSKGSQSIRYN